MIVPNMPLASEDIKQKQNERNNRTRPGSLIGQWGLRGQGGSYMQEGR